MLGLEISDVTKPLDEYSAVSVAAMATTASCREEICRLADSKSVIWIYHLSQFIALLDT